MGQDPVKILFQVESAKSIKEVNASAIDEMRLKRDLLLEFLKRVALTLTNNDSVDQKFHDFENERRKQEIYSMSQQVQVAEEKLEYFLREFEYKGFSLTKRSMMLSKNHLKKNENACKP